MYVLFCCIVALDFATSPKTQKAPYKVLSALVPRAGVEPARTYKVRGILSPLCLPISPPGQHMEARSRVELDYTNLQSAV